MERTMERREKGLSCYSAFLVRLAVPFLNAQMDPYFTAINYPVPQDTMMVMLLSDFQSARSTNDFFTGMGMVQYGLTPRWTVGFMAEGQKIFGLPTTYGGLADQ